MSNAIKTASAKLFRHPALVPVPVPITLDAEAMPGAILLGEDGVHYASSKTSPGGNYAWTQVIRQEDTSGQLGTSSAVIAVGPTQTVVGTITLPIFVTIVSVATTESCWLRIYNSPNALSEDANRTRNIAPTRGLGVVADPVFLSPSTIWWDPIESFLNRQDPPSTVYPLRITNDSLSTTSITITVNYFT